MYIYSDPAGLNTMFKGIKTPESRRTAIIIIIIIIIR